MVQKLPGQKPAGMTAARLNNNWNLGPVILYTRSPAGRQDITYVSENVKAHLGHEPQDFLDRPSFWNDLIHREDRPRVRSNLKSLTKNGQCVEEYRIRHKDGTYRWVRDQLTLDREGRGKPPEIIGHVFDVTDQKKAEEELREKEALLNGVIDNLPALIFLRDKAGRYILTNKEFDQRHGIQPGSALGKTPDTLVSKETSDEFLAADQKILKGGAVVSKEIEMTYGDGATRTVLTNKFPILGQDGKPVAVGVVSTDITERKRAEDALRQSESQLRAIVDNSPSYIYIRDTEGRYQLVGKELCRLLGTTSDEIKGKTPSDFYAPGMADTFLAKDREVMKTGQPFATEMAVTYPSGESRTVISTKFPLFEAGNTPTGVCAIVIDITERKKIEDALRESEERFRAVVDNAPAAIHLKDTEGRYVLVNKRFEEWNGISQDKVMGKTAYDIFPKGQADSYSALDREVKESRAARELEFDIPDRDGAVRSTIVVKFPIFGLDGAATGIGGFNIDITERKRAEDARRQSEAQLKAIVDNSPSNISIRDTQGRYLQVGKETRRLFGTTREKILGKTPSDFYSPDMADKMLAEDREVIKTGQPVTSERSITYPSGKARTVISTKFPLLEAGEVPMGVCTITIDITERTQAEEALRRSEAQLMAVVDNSPNYIYIRGADGRYLLASKQICRLLGTTPEKIKGTSPSDYYPDDIAENFLAEDREVLRTGRTMTTERGIFYPTREARTVISTKFPLFETDGSLVGICAIVADISERKRMEEALRESEERFRAVVDNSPTAIYLKDNEGRYLLTNKKHQEWYGDDLQGKHFSDCFPKEMADFFHATDWDVVDKRSAQEYEFEFTRPDGTLQSNFMIKFPILAPNGDSMGIGGITTDVTERKKTEQALRESEELFRSAFETTAQGMALVGLDGRWLNINDALCTITGYSHEELLAIKFQSITHPDDLETDMENLRQLLAGEISTYQREKRYVHKQGHIVWVLLSVAMIRDPDGSPLYFVTQVQDVSGRKVAEEQLRQAQKMEAVGQLTGGIAHDFNNLLTIAIGNLQLLDENIQDDQPLKKHIEPALDAMFRGADLTSRLLAFARKQILEPQIIDVNKHVSEMGDMLRRTIGEAIQIKVVLAEDPWRTLIDPTQLEAALLNLTINARDAMPDGGMITIEVANAQLDHTSEGGDLEVTAGPYVMIAVSDSGTGMPEDVRLRAFEPFFSTKETSKGSGLGLSMIYGFVRQSGGYVYLYSEEGQGTVVKLYLPKTESSEATTAEETTRVEELPTGGETVLVVEDNTSVRIILTLLLKELGYRVLAAKNGPTALDSVDEHDDIDLLLTDVIMPGGMNGAALAREAKKRRPNLKVLYTSGYTQNVIAHGGVLDEGIELISKPYSKAELASKVRRALES
jgi:PAS domain S-box-containing protein